MEQFNPTFQNSESFVIFKNSIIKFTKPSPSNVFDCDNLKGITRLSIGLSHLREHKSKHIFQDCLNRICSWSLDIESNSHFLFQCPIFNDER